MKHTCEFVYNKFIYKDKRRDRIPKLTAKGYKMEENTMKKRQRIAAWIMVSTLVITTLLSGTQAAAEESGNGLVNIAEDCEVTVPENENGIANMFDGDTNTIWCPATQAGWPATVIFKLPAENTQPVEKISMKFKVENTSQENWAMDIKLGYYVNSVTTDELTAKEVTGHKLKDEFVFEFEEPINVSHVLVTMDNPTDGNATAGFWPQIAEMGIFVAEDGQETDLTNLASGAAVTSCGGSAGTASNLVDNNYSTLYVFYNGGMSSIQGEAWVQADLGRDVDVSSLEVAFEHLASDSNNFHFTYSVYGMSSEDQDWTPLVKSATADRVENSVNEHLLGVDGASVKLSKVKIVIEEITSTGGDPWPAIAELKIFGKEQAIEDPDNLAWNKPAHTNTNSSTADRITDGNTAAGWSGAYYPGYVDIDLEENYNISDIEVYLPTTGYSQYDVYTSMDGRDFTKLLSKTDKEASSADGDRYEVEVEARYVRVYVNYQSSGSNAVIHEVRILGEASGTPLQEKPPVETGNFEGSEYDIEITDEMAIEEVQGIISRQLGDEYVDWFTFELAENPNGTGYDYYTLSEDSGKIHIAGNDGVSLATGLNYYLKYYLNVHISQVGNQVNMPEKAVSLDGETITRETKLPVRYAYNYCTLSYAMAFWGEEEWRNELDWLALNGVNAVLDATAQEEVWRRFLMECGYTEQEAKDFIAGPAYYAWAYMANMSGYGGPVHDSWFEDRTELARKNQLSMRKLGMQPILQGYCGMVPIDIESKDPSTKGSVIAQGTWCSFTRPSMLNVTSEAYSTYAERFYRIQKDVFGDVTDYYATDPYHEGGNAGGVAANTVGSNVLGAMMKADENAVWIIQSWGSNPTTGLLQGIAPNKEHALILDLYAEKQPRWESFNGTSEFSDTPWVYCMLNNFGGRLGLHGHIENFVNEVPRAINSADYMRGIGITPEASVNNPVLYDLFFETIWAEDADNVQAVDLDQWFKDYTTRRYGAESESAYQAMLILNDTVYNPALNMKGQGAPESVVNARPAESITAASTWGNAVIDYDKEDLEKAAALLLEDYDILKDSEGYQYDLANVLEQILSNSAQEYHKAMVRAYQSGDLEQFTVLSDTFLSLIDMVEKVTGTQEKFMVGTWIEQAKGLADNADEFTKELYEFNARSLITTWGSINQANAGGLHDYSNRQWSGLTEDYYKPRWEKWIAERKKDLSGESGQNFTNAQWFEMEWEWVNSNNEYPTEPNGLDLKELGEEVLKTYSVTAVPKDPAEDDSRDLTMDGWIITAGSEQSTSGSEGPASNLIDNNTSTIWHSTWAGTAMENLWINIHMPEPAEVDGLRYLPRTSGTNGIITGYVIQVSSDNGATYHEAASGTWAGSSSWKTVSFGAEKVTDVRLQATAARTDSSGNNYASGAEIRLTGSAEEEPSEPVSKKTLEYFLNQAKGYVEDGTVSGLVESIQQLFTDAIAKGEAVMADEDATREEVLDAAEDLMLAIHALNMKAADKTDLQMALELTELIDLSKYVEAGQAEYLAAKEAAEAVMADGDAMQAETDEAWSRLVEAMEALRLKADKSVLQDLISQMEGLDLSGYTEESVTMFRAALASANSIFMDETLSVDEQAKVDEAVIALQAAYDGLMKAQGGGTETPGGDTDDPQNPGGSDTDDPQTPDGDSQSGDQQTAGGSDSGAQGSTTAGQAQKTGSGAVQTGDDASAAAAGMILLLSVGAILLVVRKRVRL